MAYLLLVLLILGEIGFLVFSLVKKPAKKTWALWRMAVNIGELLLFFVSLLLPGIDTGFRFKALIILLVVRILIAGLFALMSSKQIAVVKTVDRKTDTDKSYANDSKGKNHAIGVIDSKKFPGMIASLLLSILLFAVAMVPAFVFADYKGLPLSGPYEVKMCKAILIDPNRVEEFENDGSNREVPLYFFYPDNTKAEEKYPLVIFSHGAFGYYQSNISTYQALASNGYIVVSLEHPYHSFFTKDTEGKTIIVDSGFMNDVMTTAQNGTEEEIFPIAQEWMELRVADMNFAIDEIKKGAEMQDTEHYFFADESTKSEVMEVLGRIDTESIGLMGHSMGGATSVEVGKERDDIDAVIDIDGTMLGSIIGAEDHKYVVEEIEYSVPILEFENQSGHEEALEAERIGYPYPNNMIRKNAETYFGTYVEGSEHMDYTDLPMFSPVLGRMLGSGDVDHEYVMEQVNSLTVKFFDCYLKGEGTFSVKESYPGTR